MYKKIVSFFTLFAILDEIIANTKVEGETPIKKPVIHSIRFITIEK